MVDFDAEQDTMMADVIDTFGVAVTLTRRVLGSMNFTTGQRAATTTTQNVMAVRRPQTKITFGAGTSGRGEMIEERVYDIRVSDVTGTIKADATDQWLVTDNSKAVEVQKVELSVDRKNYILTCRSTK